jgi:hypothetical protein
MGCPYLYSGRPIYTYAEVMRDGRAWYSTDRLHEIDQPHPPL